MRAPRYFWRARSSTGALTLPRRTSVAPKRSSSWVDEA